MQNGAKRRNGGERRLFALGTGAPESGVSEYRDRILYALAIVATLVVLPFSIHNFLLGFTLIGAMSLAVVIVLVVDAVAIYRGRRPPLPMGVAFGVIVLGVVFAVYQRGLMSVFWTYPAILLFHFVLERKLANVFNLAMVAIVGVAIYPAVEADFTLRIVATQLLTIAFTNIFSYAVEAESRKETEQRRRLGLLVRATQAGFYQWERATGIATYSGRLKEMLGHPADADTSAWPPFVELIHPDERAERFRLFQEGVRARGEPNGVRRNAGGEFRVQHAGSGTRWLQSEGIFIHDARGRVERYIASLVDVTERRHQQEALRSSLEQIEVQAGQLRDQNAELRSAIRVREEVERIARHDIKTPLNSIVAVPRMLRESRRLDEREERLLNMVEGAGYRILDMINLSVDLYRMEQGQYRFNPRAVDLTALVQTVAREIRAHAETKGLRLSVPERRVFAWAEELLCYSILANLMKNAVEASPDGAAVTVSFAARRGNIVLGVHNAGVVPADVRESFFNKYSTSGKAGGFGLGTYSARLMSRVQEGELAMTTSEEGGTTLELTLRAVPEGAAVAGVRPIAEAPDDPVLRAGELPPLTVLVADDDEFNVLFVKSSLPSPPLAVHTAVNGRAAVEAARAHQPDVVLMDLEMPVMDGYEALAWIRDLDAQRGKRSTVIAFSSHDDDVTRRRCVEAGFDAYLAKPAPRERLHQILRSAVAGKPVPGAFAAATAAPAAPDDPVEIDPELAPALPRFLETRRAVAAALEDAVSKGDRETARVAAHKLAGSLALYGFHWAAAASRAIQRDAARGELADLERQCAALRAHLEAVKLRPREGHEPEKEAAAGG